jgi:rod shape-determining protein MreC
VVHAVAPAAISVGLIYFHQIGLLAPFERLAAAPLAAVQDWLNSNLREFNNVVTTLQTIGALRERVDTLATENDRLTVENAQLREELNKASIFEKLLKYERANADLQYLPADVIGRDTNPNLHTIRLNKGIDHGVDHGMPVVTERGLVGRVTDVGPNWCEVLLLIDNASSVRARLRESRAEGVVTGKDQNSLLMDYITQGITVSPGEVVLTSGMGGTFPAGLIIGQVTTVRQSDEALFQQADVRPSVDFDQLEVVLIIINFDRPTTDEPPGGPNDR